MPDVYIIGFSNDKLLCALGKLLIEASDLLLSGLYTKVYIIHWSYGYLISNFPVDFSN